MYARKTEKIINLRKKKTQKKFIVSNIRCAFTVLNDTIIYIFMVCTFDDVEKMMDKICELKKNASVWYFLHQN